MIPQTMATQEFRAQCCTHFSAAPCLTPEVELLHSNMPMCMTPLLSFRHPLSHWAISPPSPTSTKTKEHHALCPHTFTLIHLSYSYDRCQPVGVKGEPCV